MITQADIIGRIEAEIGPYRLDELQDEQLDEIRNRIDYGLIILSEGMEAYKDSLDMDNSVDIVHESCIIDIGGGHQ